MFVNREEFSRHESSRICVERRRRCVVMFRNSKSIWTAESSPPVRKETKEIQGLIMMETAGNCERAY